MDSFIYHSTPIYYYYSTHYKSLLILYLIVMIKYIIHNFILYMHFYSIIIFIIHFLDLYSI